MKKKVGGTQKICICCSKIFISKGQNQKYCSKNCRYKQEYANKFGKIKKIICPVCKNKFSPARRNTTYCSEKCSSFARNIKSNYGINLEFLNKLFARQNNKCAICNRKFDLNSFNKKHNIDHNHKTGKIRGLLCNNCNWLLGQAQDNINILKNAIEYLGCHYADR